MHGAALERAGQTTDDEDQAGAAKLAGLIDRAEIVFQRRRQTGLIDSGKQAATAVSGESDSGFANQPISYIQATCGDLVSPRRDRGNAVSRTSFDDLR